MPISIIKFGIKKDFEEDSYISNNSNYTNNSIVKLAGRIRRTPNDNIVFLLYYGLREDYKKNKSIKISVDEEGNFETVINLEDGDGKYYLTSKLLLDDGEYDLVTVNCFYKIKEPILNDFQIENHDFFTLDLETNENVYIIKSKNKNELKFNFTSYLNDLENKYFYKFWLSNEEEPNFILPLNRNKVNETVNISNLTNGVYFLYLKIIDLSDNVTFKKIKININRNENEISLNYLTLINKDYYIDLNKKENLISLLIQNKKGINIKKAEYRIFEGNKILTPKSIEEFDKINSSLLEELKTSGFYYLKSFDINTHFNLLDGKYNIQIFYVDEYNKEFNTNKIDFIIKSNSSELYTNELSLDNISSLIFTDSNKIKMYLKDDFFTINNKQIKVKMFEKNSTTKFKIVSSKNTNWKNEKYNIWSTELTVFLNDENLNFDGKNYKHNIYEFSIENDYYEESKFTIPIIYKKHKNIISLHENFININNKLNPLLNYINENGTNGEFLISNSLDFFNINIDIKNEVDFEEISNYKTHNNKVNLIINGKEEIKEFYDSENIWIDIQMPSEENHDEEEYESKNNNYNLELKTIEFYKNVNNNSNISFFNIKTFDEDRFTIPFKEIFSYDLEDRVIVELPKNLNIKNNQFLKKDIFTPTHSYLNIKKQKTFNINEYKELEFFDVIINEEGNEQKELNYTFNIEFYKNITNVFKNVVLTDLIENEYFDFYIEYPYENIEKDLIFYFDCLNENLSRNINFVKNSHEFEIITIENKKYFKFKNLEIEKFKNENDYSFNCYYKYKKIEKVFDFNIKYSYKILNRNITINKINDILYIKNNNYFNINLENTKIDEIETIDILYNNQIKETINEIKETNFSFLLKNNFLNKNINIIKIKINFKNKSFLYSNVLNYKTLENYDLINIASSKNKFIDYIDFSNTKIKFTLFNKQELIIEPTIRKICGLYFDNKLNLNENYENILTSFKINKNRLINLNKIIDFNLNNGYYILKFIVTSENGFKETIEYPFYITNKKLSINKIEFLNSTFNSLEQNINIETNANIYDNFSIFYETDEKKILKNNTIFLKKNDDLKKLFFTIKNNINNEINTFNNFTFIQEVENNDLKLNLDIVIKEKIIIKQQNFEYDLIKSENIKYDLNEFELINKNDNLFIYISDINITDKITIEDLKKEIKIIDIIDHKNSFLEIKNQKNENLNGTQIDFIEQFILNNPQKVLIINPKNILKIIKIKKEQINISLNTNKMIELNYINHKVPLYLSFNYIKEKRINTKISLYNYYKIFNHIYFKDKNIEFHKFYFDLSMIKLKSESIFNNLNKEKKELICCVLIEEYSKIFPIPIDTNDIKILNQIKNRLNVLQVKNILKILNGVDIINENLC